MWTVSLRLTSGYRNHPNLPLHRKRCENSGPRRSREKRHSVHRQNPDLMPSTHKKVIVRKMDRDSVNGYVSPANYIVEGKLELLNTSGTVVAIDL